MACHMCGTSTFYVHSEVIGAPMVELELRPHLEGTIRLHGDPLSASQRPQIETLGPLEIVTAHERGENLYRLHTCKGSGS